MFMYLCFTSVMLIDLMLIRKGRRRLHPRRCGLDWAAARAMASPGAAPSSRRPPDGVGTNRVFTEGPHLLALFMIF